MKSYIGRDFRAARRSVAGISDPADQVHGGFFLIGHGRGQSTKRFDIDWLEFARLQRRHDPKGGLAVANDLKSLAGLCAIDEFIEAALEVSQVDAIHGGRFSLASDRVNGERAR